ncbi:hypothetical protein LCGC14_1508080, partial [marine sediment metagenome]
NIPTMSGTITTVSAGNDIIAGGAKTDNKIRVLGDTGIFEVGDEIEVQDASLGTRERMVITAADVAAIPVDYTVMRGARGTTLLATFAIGDPVYVIGKDVRAVGQAIPAGRAQKKAFVNAYVQAFEEAATIVKQEKSIGQPLGKGAADSWADEKLQSLGRLKHRMELAFLHGIATAAHETAADDREGYATDGVITRITAALGSVVVTLDAAGQLSQSVFDDQLIRPILAKYSPKGEMWALGGRKVYEAGPAWLTSRSIVQGQNLKGIFGADTNKYQSRNGPVITFIYDAALNIFAKDTLVLINPNYVQVVNGPNETRIPRFVDAAQRLANIQEGFWTAEAGLKIECPWAHGKIVNVVQAV